MKGDLYLIMVGTSQNNELLVSDIFAELANEVRCNILIELDEGSSTPSEITSKMNLPVQEIHRQLNRLESIGLIEKNPNGVFSLTTNGKITISQLSFFQFITKFKDYFSKHFCDILPDDLIRRMGVLKNSDFLLGTGTVIEKYKEIVSEKTTMLRVTLPQIVTDANSNVLNRAKNGMKVLYIYGENTIVPPENLILESKIGLKQLISDGLVQKRKIKHVGITVVITDYHSMVFFPDSTGESDINCTFLSEDELVREWCLDFFNKKWSEGVPMNE